MSKYHIPLTPGTAYHVYNHAVGYDNLFREPVNYDYFMDRYKHFLSEWIITYAYCLLPNHFHFIIEIPKFEETGLPKKMENKYTEMLSRQFANFFQSYSQSFNKYYQRKGSLFRQNFKRKEIDSDDYFMTLVLYIHFNPVNHEFAVNLDDWIYSSYHEIMNNPEKRLLTGNLLQRFGDLERFKKFHNYNLHSEFIVEFEQE